MATQQEQRNRIGTAQVSISNRLPKPTGTDRVLGLECYDAALHADASEADGVIVAIDLAADTERPVGWLMLTPQEALVLGNALSDLAVRVLEGRA